MFLSAAEEFERQVRQQEAYGESPDWIRRVLRAYLAREEARNRALLRQARLGSRADIPLGQPISIRGAQVTPSTGLPSLAQPAGGGQISSLPTTGSSQPTASNQTVIPAQSTQETAQMDLGNLLNQVGQAVDIYGRYRRFRDQPAYMGGTQLVGTDLMGPLTGRNPLALGRVTPGGIIGGIVGGGIGELAQEFLGGGMDPMACTKPSDVIYTWNPSTQSYEPRKKPKRRRRRLATHSDIKDLAALKSVLGSGKAFDTWIATRRM